MQKNTTFPCAGKTVTLYGCGQPGAPLIVLNEYEGDGEAVVRALDELCAPPCDLLVISDLRWDHDMSPWACPPLSKEDEPCTGGADDYLALLTRQILPEAKSRLSGSPRFTAIAGYSLAGLFALYAMYRCGAFDRAASVSGSLWFPDFRKYAMTHEMGRPPERLYLSLGDKEARTRHPLLKTVQESTEQLVSFYKHSGISVTWELNPGNHFRDAALRTAKGIRALLA